MKAKLNVFHHRAAATLFAAALVIAGLSGTARAFETQAGSAWVIDHNTGQVLSVAQCRRAAAAGVHVQADDAPDDLRGAG
jgi:D-alanyl-D-alanine carboxypeptidase